MRQVNGVLHNVDLGVKVGRHVDGGIGNQQRFGVARHVQHIHMADAAFGAQSGLAVDHRAQHLVAVQTAFHERGDVTAARQLDGFGGGGVAVRHIDNRKTRQIKAAFAGQAADFGFRADQQCLNQAQPGGVECAFKRLAATGMHDTHFDFGQRFGGGQ